MIDEAEVEALRAENESRMHARMNEERAAGNQMTDEELEAFVKERCVAAAGAAGQRRRALGARRPPAGPGHPSLLGRLRRPTGA